MTGNGSLPPPVEPQAVNLLPPIPWGPREVWVGVVSLAIWFGAVIGLQVLAARLKIDSGIFVSLSEALLVVPVVLLTLVKYRVKVESLGLRRFKGLAVAFGCGLVVLFYAFNLGYGLFLQLFHLRVQPSLVPLLGKLPTPLWFWIGGVLVAPVAEEIFFRGFVFGGLRGRYGFQKAALVSALLFAVLHLQWTAVLPIAILGYIFAFLYENSGSIWPGILMHFAINACGLSVAFYAAQHGLAG